MAPYKGDGKNPNRKTGEESQPNGAEGARPPDAATSEKRKGWGILRLTPLMSSLRPRTRGRTHFAIFTEAYVGSGQEKTYWLFLKSKLS